MLTEDDILKISQLFNEGFHELIEPRLDDLEKGISGLQTDVTELKSDVHELKSDVHELKSDVQQLKSDVRRLDQRMDSLVITTDNALKGQLELLGQYQNDFVQQRDFFKLEKRVQKLELAKA